MRAIGIILRRVKLYGLPRTSKSMVDQADEEYKRILIEDSSILRGALIRIVSERNLDLADYRSIANDALEKTNIDNQ